MPAIRKIFDLMGVDVVDLSTENEGLENKAGFSDEKWLEEAESNILKQVMKKGLNIKETRLEKQQKKPY